MKTRYFFSILIVVLLPFISRGQVSYSGIVDYQPNSKNSGPIGRYDVSINIIFVDESGQLPHFKITTGVKLNELVGIRGDLNPVVVAAGELPANLIAAIRNSKGSYFVSFELYGGPRLVVAPTIGEQYSIGVDEVLGLQKTGLLDQKERDSRRSRALELYTSGELVIKNVSLKHLNLSADASAAIYAFFDKRAKNTTLAPEGEPKIYSGKPAHPDAGLSLPYVTRDVPENVVSTNRQSEELQRRKENYARSEALAEQRSAQAAQVIDGATSVVTGLMAAASQRHAQQAQAAERKQLREETAYAAREKEGPALIEHNRDAAEQGNMQAEFNLGRGLFWTGDIQQAFKWFRKAADQGYADAYKWMAYILYYYPEMMSANDAIAYFQTPGEIYGSTSAMYVLSTIYAARSKQTQSNSEKENLYDKAIYFARQAAEAGNYLAMEHLYNLLTTAEFKHQKDASLARTTFNKMQEKSLMSWLMLREDVIGAENKPHVVVPTNKSESIIFVKLEATQDIFQPEGSELDSYNKLMGNGVAMFNAQKYKEAFSEFVRAEQYYNTDSNASLYAARAAFHAKDYGRAYRWAYKVNEGKFSGKQELYELMIESSLHLGDTSKALADAAQMINQLGPVEAPLRRYVNLHFSADKYGLTIPLLAKVSNGNPLNEFALFALGYAYDATGMHVQSEQTYRKLLAVNPDYQNLQLNLANTILNNAAGLLNNPSSGPSEVSSVESGSKSVVPKALKEQSIREASRALPLLQSVEKKEPEDETLLRTFVRYYDLVGDQTTKRKYEEKLAKLTN